jgi:acyl phosphate:glycerol-3-phosphate acyltransferase
MSVQPPKLSHPAENSDMPLFLRVVHVVALGLWFGTTIFFTFVVGFSLFGTFEFEASKPADQRPIWLPVPPEFDKAPPSARFPDPLRKEQGTRIAGAAVNPMFLWYFAIQSFCGGAALLTALAWARLNSRVPLVHKIRTIVLLAAVCTVAVGWWLEQVVSDLTQERNKTTDVVLRSPSPSSEDLQKADAARAQFSEYHGYSMIVNLLTVILVTAAMGLAAVLPERESGEPMKPAPTSS